MGGIALGTLGVVLVIATSGVEFSTGTLRGDLLTVLGVLCWAGYTLGLRRLPAGVSPLRVTTVTAIAGTPGLVLAGLPGMLRVEWAAVPGTGVGRAGYATVFSLVVAYILWNRSVQTGGGDPDRDLHVRDPLVAVRGAPG